MLIIGLVALLKSDDALSALIEGRISPVLLREGICLPALTYHIVGGSSSPTLNTSGMQRVRIEFDAFGRSYLEAANVREALRILLNGYQGPLSNGMYLQNVEFVQAVDFYDSDPRQFRCMSEFYVYFNFPS